MTYVLADVVAHYAFFFVVVLRREMHRRILFFALQADLFLLVRQVIVLLFDTTVLFQNLTLSPDSSQAPCVHICNILSTGKLRGKALKPIYSEHQLVITVPLAFLIKA